VSRWEGEGRVISNRVIQPDISIARHPITRYRRGPGNGPKKACALLRNRKGRAVRRERRIIDPGPRSKQREALVRESAGAGRKGTPRMLLVIALYYGRGGGGGGGVVASWLGEAPRKRGWGGGKQERVLV